VNKEFLVFDFTHIDSRFEKGEKSQMRLEMLRRVDRRRREA
jgi:hypothetical protein